MKLTRPSAFLLLLFFLVIPGLGISQAFNPDAGSNDTDIHPKDVIHWQTLGGDLKSSGVVEVGMRLLTKQNFSLYKDNLKFTPPPGFTVTDVKAPPTRDQFDEISNSIKSVYYGGEFFISMVGPTDYSETRASLSITYIGCTNKICLFPFTEEFSFKLTDKRKPIDPAAEVDNAETIVPPNQTAKPLQSEESLTSQWTREMNEGTISFAMLIFICFVAGVGTNLTPCVYPMIPITLRLLGREGHTIKNSIAYASGILVSYTSIGFFAAATGSLFGAFMANPIVNIILFLVMILLGLSMLGFFNFSKIQSLGAKLGQGKASFKNTFLMGTGAGLVASPCTGPIFATLLVNSAKSGAIYESTFLIFIYSLGFSLPYILLGSTANKISKINLGAKVQLAVEIVFSSIMFGLAFYYLRIPAYKLTQTLSPIWGNIAISSLLLGAIATVLLLINKELRIKQKLFLVPALLLGMAAFSGFQWGTSSAPKENVGGKMAYFYNEAEAFAFAKQENKYILIDAWAEWCQACKEMDATTFKDARVKSKFEKEDWILLKLDLTEIDEAAEAINEKYEIQGLPTLILMPPDGDLKKKKNLAGYQDAAALLQHMAEYRKGT